VLLELTFATLISAASPGQQCISGERALSEHHNPYRPAANQLVLDAALTITLQKEAQWLAAQSGAPPLYILAARYVQIATAPDRQSYGVYFLDADRCVVIGAVVPYKFLAPIFYQFGILRYDGFFELHKNGTPPYSTSPSEMGL
jgi:hypothetical protein|tara:strand:- start:18 stop:449 length:432 start_codon:yes stop_codon:yes gene_type:complete